MTKAKVAERLTPLHSPLIPTKHPHAVQRAIRRALCCVSS